jgi:hypothetical protein
MKVRYLAIVVAIALLLLMVGCGKKAAPAPAAPEPAPAAPEPAPAPEPEPAVVEEPAEVEEIVLEEGGDITEMAEEEKEAEGLAVDLAVGEGEFAQAGCELRQVDGEQKRVLSVVVKNTGTDEWEIYGMDHVKGKVRIGNRGVVDVTPGCESMILAPGESTVCSTVDNGAVIEGENRVTVNTPAGQFARVVECP